MSVVCKTQSKRKLELRNNALGISNESNYNEGLSGTSFTVYGSQLNIKRENKMRQLLTTICYERVLCTLISVKTTKCAKIYEQYASIPRAEKIWLSPGG